MGGRQTNPKPPTRPATPKHLLRLGVSQPEPADQPNASTQGAAGEGRVSPPSPGNKKHTPQGERQGTRQGGRRDGGGDQTLFLHMCSCTPPPVLKHHLEPVLSGRRAEGPYLPVRHPPLPINASFAPTSRPRGSSLHHRQPSPTQYLRQPIAPGSSRTSARWSPSPLRAPTSREVPRPRAPQGGPMNRNFISGWLWE